MLCTLQLLGKLRNTSIHTLLEVNQSLSNGTIQGNHGAGTVGLRTYGTELKAVAGEGEWRGTVTVGIIDEQLRNLRNIHLHALLASHCQEVVLVGLLDVVEQLRELFAEE